MNRRQSTLVVLLLVGGCLAPHYGVDATDSVDAGGSSGAASSGKPASSAAGQSDTGGGASNPDLGQSGDASEAGSPSTITCDATQKKCGGGCVDISDVSYGCGATTCNQTGCPADPEAVLGCEGESCVAVGCAKGSKLCDSRCVSENDPTFGCGPTACDDTACPDPGPATLTCSGGACVVGDCGSDTKKCGSKCVPKNEDNGCAATACEPCASNQVCSGTPSECACVPNGDPCAGFDCGSATDSCGKTKQCRNNCGPLWPFCVDNACHQCKADTDCKGSDVDPCFKPVCTNNTCGLAIAAPNTDCPGKGTCSATLAGVCERAPVSVGTYNIDATEVTSGQYEAFLKAKAGDVSGQIAACSWNTTYTPTSNWPVYPEAREYPITWVDWCDANAYCKWAGRRLCGKIGGGSWLSNTRDLNGTVSQWVHACMPASGVEYPYGSSFNINACNARVGGTSQVRAATYPLCVGGVAGLYDMSGNVAEWSDHCDAYVGKDDSCAAEGGDYDPPNDSGATLICSLSQSYFRSLTAPNIGFRCCGP